MSAPPALNRASRALVREMRALALELPALDVGDPRLVAVDASGSGTGPVGAFAVIDGAGHARCYTFLIGPDEEEACSLSYLIEALAALAALRSFPSESAVTLISDSEEVEALIRTVRRPHGHRPTGAIHRAAPSVAWKIRGHCQRLDVTVRPDRSTGLQVAESPHMIAAHRLALAALRLRTDGHDPACDDEARRWLTRFAQLPGGHIKSIQWRAGNFGRRHGRKARRAAAVAAVLRPLAEVVAEHVVEAGSLQVCLTAVNSFRRKTGGAGDPMAALRELVGRMFIDPCSRAVVLPDGELLVELGGPTVVLDARARRVERYANSPEHILLRPEYASLRTARPGTDVRDG